MKLGDIFTPMAMGLSLSSWEKEGVLRELVHLLVQGHGPLDQEKAIQVLLEREQLGSTAIGEGVAIPHGKIEGLSQVVGAFARSPEGVDFDSCDGERVRLFFVLMAPPGGKGADDHLRALGQIARKLRDPGFARELLALNDREALYRRLVGSDE